MRLIGLAVVLAIGLTLAPLLVQAQQGFGLPRIIVLSLSSPPDVVRAFEESMRTLGYIPGATIASTIAPRRRARRRYRP
jgi:hypothetical protein